MNYFYKHKKVMFDNSEENLPWEENTLPTNNLPDENPLKNDIDNKRKNKVNDDDNVGKKVSKNKKKEELEEKWKRYKELLDNNTYINTKDIEYEDRLIIVDFHIEVLTDYINSEIIFNKKSILKIIKMNEEFSIANKIMINSFLDIFSLMSDIISIVKVSYSINNPTKKKSVKLLNNNEINKILFEPILSTDKIQLYKNEDIEKHDIYTIGETYLTLNKVKNYLVYRKPYVLMKPEKYESYIYRQTLIDLYYNTQLAKKILLCYENNKSSNEFVYSSKLEMKGLLNEDYIKNKRKIEESYQKIKNKKEPIILSNDDSVESVKNIFYRQKINEAFNNGETVTVKKERGKIKSESKLGKKEKKDKKDKK
jgi:hypothetical protein